MTLLNLGNGPLPGGPAPGSGLLPQVRSRAALPAGRRSWAALPRHRLRGAATERTRSSGSTPAPGPSPSWATPRWRGPMGRWKLSSAARRSRAAASEEYGGVGKAVIEEITMLQGEQARKEKSLGGRAVLQALRSNLSLLGELAPRYEAAFQPERPEGKASPWRAGRTHGEQARKFLPWSGTSGRAVGSGTAGRTPATDEASSSPDSQHPRKLQNS